MEGRLSVESPHMVQYSPARVYGAQGDVALHELPVPSRLHEVTQLPADSQALQVAQLLRQFIRSLDTGTAFHPHFGGRGQSAPDPRSHRALLGERALGGGRLSTPSCRLCLAPLSPLPQGEGQGEELSQHL
jgi:hypothetical protein